MKIISNFVKLAFAIFFWGASAIGAYEFYYAFKVETLTKVHQGLPSLEKFTEQLTCTKYTDKMDLVPIKIGHCAKYWVMKQAMREKWSQKPSI